MDEIISNLKNIALSGNDIYNACEKNIKILKYGQLRDFKNIDDAFNPYDAIALLYESKPNYGHWVLLLRHPKKKTIEFFDSYGIFPDDQIKKIPNEINKMVGQGFILNQGFNIGIRWCCKSSQSGSGRCGHQV